MLVARTQFTICDLADPVITGEAPASPVIDMLWMDTSESPAVLRRWNGSSWEVVNDTDIGGVNLITGTADWSGTLSSDAGMVSDGVLTVSEESVCETYAIPVDGGKKYTVSVDISSDLLSKAMQDVLTVLFRDGDNEELSSLTIPGNVTDDWTRTAHTFETPDDTFFVVIGFIEGLAYRKLQLESGTEATDWAPSPEDATEDIETLAKRVSTAEAIIEGDAIINRVFASETYVNDKSAITSLQSQQAATQLDLNNYKVAFSATRETVDAMDNNFSAWFDFSKEAVMSIGRSDSDFSMSLSNEQLTFLSKSTISSYLRGDRIYNPNLVVLKTITLGDPDLASSLQGIVDADGISWV